MFREELIEKGVVISKSESKIKIAVSDPGNCEECSVKIFCKPSENEKILEINYKGEISVGEKVKIILNGENLITLTLILYGFPLILLIIGIMTGMYYYSTPGESELYSFLTGIGLVCAYYIAVYFFLPGKLQNLFAPIVIRN